MYPEEVIMKRDYVFLSVMFVFLFLLAQAVPGVAAPKDARGLFERKCSACHSIDKPKSQGKTKVEWQATVLRMKGHGAALTDEDVGAIVDYLTRTYPKK
jgi:mono/diheme cytochrome c family protein